MLMFAGFTSKMKAPERARFRDEEAPSIIEAMSSWAADLMRVDGIEPSREQLALTLGFGKERKAKKAEVDALAKKWRGQGVPAHRGAGTPGARRARRAHGHGAGGAAAARHRVRLRGAGAADVGGARRAHASRRARGVAPDEPGKRARGGGSTAHTRRTEAPPAQARGGRTREPARPDRARGEPAVRPTRAPRAAPDVDGRGGGGPPRRARAQGRAQGGVAARDDRWDRPSELEPPFDLGGPFDAAHSYS